MTTAAVIVDWLTLLGELSLARTTAQFVAAVEKAARDLDCQSPRLFLYRLADNMLDGRTPVDAASLAGRAALYCETVTEGLGVAVPVTHFGSLVGVLQAESGSAEVLAELGRLAGVVYDALRSREEERSALDLTRELLVQSTDRVVPEGEGHVDRVAQLSTKIATLLDLSEQARQELWDAAYHHDLGCLLLEGQPFDVIRAQHAEAGARLLEATGALSHLAPLVAVHHQLYADSPAPDRVPLEGWVLALAEDLDEFLSERRYLSLPEGTRMFYEQRARMHHPDAVDALSGLIDSESLNSLYPAAE